MQSIVIYVVTDKSKLEQPLTVRHTYVNAGRRPYQGESEGGAWIRVEVIDADVVEALDHAKPLPGESFCNSHPLV